MSSDIVPSSLYPYVYHFLVDNGLTETAESLKNEAKLKKPKKSRPETGLVDVLSFFVQHKGAAASNGAPEEANGAPEEAVEAVPEPAEKKEKKKKAKKAKKAAEAADEEEETPAPAPSAPAPEASNKREREEDSDETPPAKKPKAEAKASNKPSKKSQKGPQTPFQRINPNLADALPEELQDNNWLAREADPYAAKAYKDLSVTKGKGFRHEKTKKKRGTYKGGEIDTGIVNSYIFPE
jgi:hypothetical protein